MRAINLAIFLFYFSVGAASAFVRPLPIARRQIVPSLTVSRSSVPVDHTTEAKKDYPHPDPTRGDTEFTIPLEEVCLDDLPKVGGKTASLGEMIQQLAPLGVAVPGGFAVSSTAYDAVLDQAQLRERLQLLMKDVDGNYNICAL